jgi:hypothetical protein
MVLARDNKALNQKHAEILRGLIKQGDNKICADCKRNGELVGLCPSGRSWV